MQLPPGAMAQQAYDLVTREPVPIASSEDGFAAIDVADDPIALLLIPSVAIQNPGCDRRAPRE